jgi:hypothetical protein
MEAQSQPQSYVICPTCQALNGRFETVCDECGASIGDTSTLDPDPTIPAQSLPPKKLASRLRPIVLIGIWIIFLPAFVSNTYAAILWATHHHRRLAEFIFFWGAVGLAFLSLVMLYWATKKYVVSRSNK